MLLRKNGSKLLLHRLIIFFEYKDIFFGQVTFILWGVCRVRTFTTAYIMQCFFIFKNIDIFISMFKHWNHAQQKYSQLKKSKF